MLVCHGRPAPIMALTIEQPNVMQVIEFRETPEPLIVMEYYEHGNIVEAGVAYDQYVTAIGQILGGLDHLHVKGVAHRDLKPKNLSRSTRVRALDRRLGAGRHRLRTAVWHSRPSNCSDAEKKGEGSPAGPVAPLDRYLGPLAPRQAGG